MTEQDILGLVGQAATWVVFLALYLYERRRNSRLEDARIRDYRAWMNFLSEPTGKQIFDERPNGSEDED